jgi:DNA-binding NarL/FixJ family response regulator
MTQTDNEALIHLPRIYSKSSYPSPSIELIASAKHRDNSASYAINIDVALNQINNLYHQLKQSCLNDSRNVDWVQIASIICKSIEVNLEFIKLTQATRLSTRKQPEFKVKDIACGPIATLSSHQLEIIKMVAKGYSNKQIASIKGIAVSSVNGQLCKAYRKLNVESRMQAVSLCKKFGAI